MHSDYELRKKKNLRPGAPDAADFYLSVVAEKVASDEAMVEAGVVPLMAPCRIMVRAVRLDGPQARPQRVEGLAEQSLMNVGAEDSVNTY